MTNLRHLLFGLATLLLAGAAPDERSAFNLASIWQDQDGRALKLADLAGQPLVVTMFYASCKTVCPLTVQQLQKIDRGLTDKARRQVRFVLVSLDASHDTPARLRDFRKAQHIDATNWVVVTGKADAVRELAAFLDVKFKADAGGEIAHSAGAFVLDQGGVLQVGEPDLNGDSRSISAALERLAR